MAGNASIGLKALLPLAALAAFSLGSRAEGESPGGSPNLHLEAVACFGQPKEGGNLLAVQPWMVPEDYISEERFAAKMEGYLQAAQRRGLLGPATIVLFPEYFAAWLVLAGERRQAFDPSLSLEGQVAPLLAASHLPSFVASLKGPAGVRPTLAGRLQAALFRMRARQAARIYDRVCADLARRYDITLVGGSLILPGPARQGRRLTVHPPAPLQSCAGIYDPWGCRAVVTKHYLLRDTEQTFAWPGHSLPVVDTPAGRLGLLICADAWYDGPWLELRRQGAELVGVLSYSRPGGKWSQPWKGFDPGPPPADVTAEQLARDLGSLTEGQAWRRYAMARAREMGAALLVGLRGRLWDLGSDGRCLGMLRGEPFEGPATEGAALVNLWL